MKKHILPAALFAALFLTVGAASALDLTDVKTLVRNNVDEAVIIGMVQQGGNFPVTTDEVSELRGMGASETLIAELLTAPRAAASVPPTVYYEAPQTVVTAPPTVVYETPTVVTPTYVYPYPYPRPHYFRPQPGISFSFGFGGGHHRPRRWHRRHW